jgi:hypothetical protein
VATFASIRKTILAADQEIIEEWKWMGSPVTSAVATRYAGSNDHHFCEKLRAVESLSIGCETLRRLLRSAGVASIFLSGVKKSHSARSARIGSVRVARQAGKKHAATDATIITANAAAKASGSRGLS